MSSTRLTVSAQECEARRTGIETLFAVSMMTGSTEAYLPGHALQDAARENA